LRVRKDEWNDFLKQNELLIQRYEALARKVKELTKENSLLREKLELAEEKLRAFQEKVELDIKESSQILQRRSAEMSRLLQQTEKELETE
jgi:cell division septum initiation protein DivIVA